jgi:hypothetical protein
MSHKVKGVPASESPASELEHYVRLEMECKLLQAVHTVDLYPSHVIIAVVYMSAHATACAPERNWSRWGNLHDKKRQALDTQRGKRIIFLQENNVEDTDVAKDEEL